MSWAYWLGLPVVGTVLAALLSWLRARPRKEPTGQRAMRAHDDFLAALEQPPRSADRGLINRGQPASGPDGP